MYSQIEDFENTDTAPPDPGNRFSTLETDGSQQGPVKATDAKYSCEVCVFSCMTFFFYFDKLLNQHVSYLNVTITIRFKPSGSLFDSVIPDPL